MRSYGLLLSLVLMACNGNKDDSAAPIDVDADSDGYLESEDCNDNDATAYPGAVELCDGIDNDCNGNIDNGAPDSDSDGTCDAYDSEDCDTLDNDGDGEVDEGLPDSDSDGICDEQDDRLRGCRRR